ncbi:hypothetical protein ACVWWI_006299 [Bradyrhizobium sp. USDA 3686]|uniref:hypothetical protein n=1 Tax=Bradyrhizobium canariense TaxID=255045 RepID=UPI0019562A8F|nr:hypothetical protein [Bradyrhizobium canariense]MBM7488149.1 hypothetical protein [Bradyrhizobium canariense]
MRGRIQREGDVINLVARRIKDLSVDRQRRDARPAFPLPHDRGDQIRNSGSRLLPPKAM